MACSKRYLTTLSKTIITVLALLLTALPGKAQQPQRYDWGKIIRIDIDRDKYPGKFKAIMDILNHMAADEAGRQIFDNIAANKQGLLKIKDKEDVVNGSTLAGVDNMFAADMGAKLIKRDMRYDPIDNDLVINFTKGGEMLSFDEGTHHFFKVSLNSVVATELERAGWLRTPTELNCRALIARMTQKDYILFNNYKDLMGEKFTTADIEHCRKKQVTIHNLASKTKDTYTFTDLVTDALKAYRLYAEECKANAYVREAHEMPLSQKYLDKVGEPRRSREPVFNVRLGENRKNDLQFGPGTGTDYISLSGDQKNVYKELKVFYDDEKHGELDNPTVLARIKEEYAAQLKYDTRALHSQKLLEYVNKLKSYFDPSYIPITDFEAVADRAVEEVMKHNPYLEGANEVIMNESIYNATKGTKK